MLSYSSIQANKNDIALVRMKTKVLLNIFVQPVCLPLPEYNFKNKFYKLVQNSAIATIVGWGDKGANPDDYSI